LANQQENSKARRLQTDRDRQHRKGFEVTVGDIAVFIILLIQIDPVAVLLLVYLTQTYGMLRVCNYVTSLK